MMETLSSAIERLTGQGFTAHFGVAGNRLRAFESGKTFGAHEVVIAAYSRFEGVSDPGDMSIVYAIETRNGTRGSLVDAFGVSSDPTVSTFLKDVPIRGTETDEFVHKPSGSHRPEGRRPDLIGRGAAVGYTGAYREPHGVDIQEVVAVQTARGPE